MSEQKTLTMNEVRISKVKLLKKIEENRKLHEQEYNETMEAYKITVREKTKERIEEQKRYFKQAIKNLEDNLAQFEKDINVEPIVNVQKPVNYLKDYDTAIGMLNFSLDDIVCLNRSEFQSYAMDDWAWKKDFKKFNESMISGSSLYLKS